MTTFELFFDLVFVFAFTQVTEFMVHDRTLLAVVHAMTLLTMLWWSWVSYSWLSNHVHVDQGIIRRGMTLSAVAIFVVALVIPEAYDDMPSGLSGPLVLVAGYAVVRSIHLSLYLMAAGADAALRRQVLITFVPFVVELGLLAVGALAGGELQTVLWVLAVTTNGALTYVTSRGGHWRVHSAAHWGERHGLVIILAIGESIVAIGDGASTRPISTPLILGSALAVLLAAAVWWLYFDTASADAEHELARKQGRSRALLALQAYTFMHLPMIAGVVVMALGVEIAIAHVEEPGALGCFGAAALFGGASLYLTSHAAFTFRMLGRWKAWRIGAGIALLTIIGSGRVISPLAALVVAVVVLAIPVAIESLARGSRGGEKLPHRPDAVSSPGTAQRTYPPIPARPGHR
ncbi:low temperature requirement protein A [Microbacterium sp. 3J1]|uniref:low temperature requirement protein A n=1 Tax=Microbacterium sp. 3J1 TaxID=861269 RepID=UPI00159EC5A6|nr:low temperature requirement protein A [Microbacterium sp. 3J1]